MLRKKTLRDIKYNKSQFFTIFLMVFLGVFVFAGVHAYMDGMQVSADNYYEKNNLQDLWLSGLNFSKDDLKQVKELDNIKDAERALTLTTTLDNYDDITIEANFIESNNISKMYVVDGEGFDKEKSGLWFDSYLAKTLNLKVGDEIKLMATNKIYTVAEVGYFVPGSYMPTQEIKAGEVGYIAASIKSLSDIHVGDTVTLNDNPADKPLKGYKKVTLNLYYHIC